MQTERQEEIINTALEIISAEGIQGLTIKNISKRIGISEPAIYRHFDSKIHILTSILELLKKDSLNIFDNKISGSTNSIDSISSIFFQHFKMFNDKPELASVLFSEELFQNENILKNKVAEVIEHNGKILVSIIVSGQENEELRNDLKAENIAIMIMGTLRLFVKKWQFSGFKFNLEEEGIEIINMIKTLIKKNENNKRKKSTNC